MIVVAPTLVQVVGVAMTVLALINFVTVISIPINQKDTPLYYLLMQGSKDKPTWWNFYNLVTETLFITSWGWIGWWEPGFALLIAKFAMVTKFPEYYIQRGISDD